MLKVLLFVLLLSVVIYGLVRLTEKRGSARRAAKPVAPDDDLDFLRDLDWQQRKERQRRRHGQDGSGAAGSTPDEQPGKDPDASPDAGPDSSATSGPDATPDPTPDTSADGGSDGGGGGD